MRVAFLKPDYGSTGGFERLVADLGASLSQRGIRAETVGFDATTRSDVVFGIRVPAGVRDQHHEYFQYLTLVERMDQLDLDDYDVVVASQPPTYLVRHPRVVAVFYHQARVFYDLSDTVVESGVVHPEVHAAAVAEIRRLDRSRVGNVHTWLAGSDEVAGRLARYWGIADRVRAFRAAPTPPARPAGPYDPAGPAVCVSRHTWTKRTELVVQAAHVDPGGHYELIGGGERLPWIHAVDARYAADPAAARDDDPLQTWRNTGPQLLDRGERSAPAGRRPSPGAVNLAILGEVDDQARDDAYDRAGVVVAPAFREDYGLTVLEAFARGRPVIVCRDGGGLVELVADTGAGLVVEPTAGAIAAAVRELRDDPDRARSLAESAAATDRCPGPTEAVDLLVRAIEDAAAG